MQEFWLLTVNFNDGFIWKFIYNFIHNLVLMTIFGLILEYFVLLSSCQARIYLSLFRSHAGLIISFQANQAN